MPDSVNNTKTRILDENDLTPLTNDDILDILDGDGSTDLPDDMPDDYEGDVTDEDIWNMLDDNDTT